MSCCDVTSSFAGKLQRVNILPIPDVLFWTSFVAPALRFTADLASCTPGMGRYFRPAVLIGLVGIALGYTLVPMLRPALAPVTLSGETRWGDGVCLQSDSSTCAAVTLLRRSGIVAEERDLARACLTSDQGLDPLGCIVVYSSIRTAYFTRFSSHHQMPMRGGRENNFRMCDRLLRAVRR